MLHGALLFLLLLGHSQAICPWLTEGSASKLLGGDVSIKVSVSDTREGSCRFVQEASHDILEILVSKAALASCPKGSTKLQGIGNQAKGCRAPGGGYTVSGRVRALNFNVTQTSRGEKRPEKFSNAQEDALEQIAEQVAGNLY